MAARKTPTIRTRRRVVHRHALDDNDVDRCSHEYGDTLDIKSISTKFMKTGKAPQHTAEPMYADFSNASDYLQAKTHVAELMQSYEKLPYEIRDQFKGPEDLMQWVDNPINRDSAFENGLITEAEYVKRGGEVQLQFKDVDKPGATPTATPSTPAAEAATPAAAPAAPATPSGAAD